MGNQSETSICNIALLRSGVRKFLTNLQTDSSMEAQLCQLFYPYVRDRLFEELDWPFAHKRVTLTVLGGSAWVSTTTYALNATVQFGGLVYVSLIANNAGNQPDQQTAAWRKISRYGWLSTYPYPADALKVRALWPAVSTQVTSVPVSASTPLVPWVRIQRSDQKIPYVIESDVLYGKVILTDLTSAECHYTTQLTDTTLFPSAFVDAIAMGMKCEITDALLNKPGLAEQQRARFWGDEKQPGYLQLAIASELREIKEDFPPDSEFIAIRRGGTLSDSSNPTVGAGITLGPF